MLLTSELLNFYFSCVQVSKGRSSLVLLVLTVLSPNSELNTPNYSICVEDVPYFAEEDMRHDRFLDKIELICKNAMILDDICGVAAHEEHLDIRFDFSYFFIYRLTVHLWQDYIEEQQMNIVGTTFKFFYSIFTIGRLNNTVTKLSKDISHENAHGLIIFCNKDHF